MSNINWFPGHMAKAIREMKESVKLVDVILELSDARAIISTSNPVVKEIIGNKPTIKIITKIDLSDAKINNEWKEYYRKNNIPCVFIDLNAKDALKKISSQIQYIMEPIYAKDIARGLKPRKVRVMVLGIPNVGKSTLINKLSKSKSASVANTPGHTRAQQWIKNEIFDLLDTPGILWPNLSENYSGEKLALIGSIKDTILPHDELLKHGLEFISNRYPSLLLKKYDLSYNNDFTLFIDKFSRLRGYLLPGGLLNNELAMTSLLQDIKNGIIGVFSLERCDDNDWYRI